MLTSICRAAQWLYFHIHFFYLSDFSFICSTKIFFVHQDSRSGEDTLKASCVDDLDFLKKNKVAKALLLWKKLENFDSKLTFNKKFYFYLTAIRGEFYNFYGLYIPLIWFTCNFFSLDSGVDTSCIDFISQKKNLTRK